MAFYVEEDRGHLMEETMYAQRARAAYRGNLVSFHMPWEQLYDNLIHLLADRDISMLPHDEHILDQTLLRWEMAARRMYGAGACHDANRGAICLLVRKVRK